MRLPYAVLIILYIMYSPTLLELDSTIDEVKPEAAHHTELETINNEETEPVDEEKTEVMKTNPMFYENF